MHRQAQQGTQHTQQEEKGWVDIIRVVKGKGQTSKRLHELSIKLSIKHKKAGGPGHKRQLPMM